MEQKYGVPRIKRLYKIALMPWTMECCVLYYVSYIICRKSRSFMESAVVGGVCAADSSQTSHIHIYNTKKTPRAENSFLPPRSASGRTPDFLRSMQNLKKTQHPNQNLFCDADGNRAFHHIKWKKTPHLHKMHSQPQHSHKTQRLSTPSAIAVLPEPANSSHALHHT